MIRSGLSRAGTAGLTLALAISGLMPTAKAAPSHSPGVTITVWTAYTQGLLSAFNELTTRFEAQYPNIKVDEVSSANYTALQQKEQSAIFAGNTPTLGQAYENWVQGYTRSGAVQDLGSYINGKQGLSKTAIKDFFVGDWKDGLLGKKRLMMPFSKSDIVLYFNGSLLRRHGIKSPPNTWAQFAADCKKLTVIQNGTPQTWCTTIQTPESDWYAWEYEWGNKVLDGHNRAAFATKNGAAPVAFFANMVRKKQVVISQTANYQDQADLDAGKTGFDISTSAGLTYEIAGARPGVAIGEAKFPAGPKGRVTELFGAPLMMFSKASSAEKEAGWLFMKWLTDTKQTAYWAENTGYMPVRRSAFNLMKGYYQQHPQQRASVEELDTARVEPALAGWSKAQNDIGTVLLQGLTNQKSPMETMKEAAQQVNADLSGQ
jgi:multiple sugar transport system substrate-binding protein